MIEGTLVPRTPEWFAARQEGITGTDLPKILGLSKYGNALSVWLDKRGELPEEPLGEAGLWGNLLEQIVAEEWAGREGVEIRPTGVWASARPGRDWMRASPDRLVTGCTATDGRGCYLEVKTRSAFVAGRWREDVPDDVLAQVAWTSMVLDTHHAHVAVLLGGQRLESFRYDRDAELENYLAVEAGMVWTAVELGMRPQVEADGAGLLLQVLNREAGPREGERELDGELVAKHLRAYADASADAAVAEEVKTMAKTELVRLLGEGPGAAHTGLVGGLPAFTYKAPAPGVTLSAKQLKRLAKDDRPTYDRLREAGYIETTTPGPRFAVKATTSEEITA